MVQHFVDAKLEFDASYIYQDVNHAIQHVHRSGLVHRGILADPHRYLVKNVSSRGDQLFVADPLYHVLYVMCLIHADVSHCMIQVKSYPRICFYNQVGFLFFWFCFLWVEISLGG
jgi:hypothetical protein